VRGDAQEGAARDAHDRDRLGGPEDDRMWSDRAHRVDDVAEPDADEQHPGDTWMAAIVSPDGRNGLAPIPLAVGVPTP
jgi:hypothetical protein